jgi:hypothetical protein
MDLVRSPLAWFLYPGAGLEAPYGEISGRRELAAPAAYAVGLCLLVLF